MQRQSWKARLGPSKKEKKNIGYKGEIEKIHWAVLKEFSMGLLFFCLS